MLRQRATKSVVQSANADILDQSEQLPWGLSYVGMYAVFVLSRGTFAHNAVCEPISDLMAVALEPCRLVKGG